MINYTSNNLVQSWVHFNTYRLDIPLLEAVNIMNDQLETKYTTNRIRQWYMSDGKGRGSRLPVNVRIYMCNMILIEVLYSCGANDKLVNSINIKKIVKMIN